MKTKTEWDQAIMNITMRIHQEFPELSKYVREMPVGDSDKHKDSINIRDLEDYYNSLDELVNNYSKTHMEKKVTKTTAIPKPSGYPLYPPSEDIYTQGKKEMEVKPGDLSKTKAPNVKKGSSNEKDFKDDMSGDDLDVPGSELDDQQESVGSEDEENNYYSLGGDSHNDLDEDKG
jgi:hypothetical protein